MNQRNRICFYLSLSLLVLFALWTALISFVDVRAVGPEGSSVGFGGLNAAFHELTGVHMGLYTVTDWLGLVPFLVVFGFAGLGLLQWIKRKSLFKVDRSILLLGGFYLIVMAAYLFFEVFVINYRPVLIEGVLEASYPSSTTMLSLCVMPTAILQLKGRIRHPVVRWGVIGTILAFTAFMVIGRLLSGVHWITDIIGGALLSAGLVLMYHSLSSLVKK